MSDVLKKEAEKFGIELDEKSLEQFEIYKKTLLEYNAVMNLTAITDDYEIDIKHFIDSMSLLSTGYIKKGDRVIDIGAGAGFPSMPCAIAFPDAYFTMLDSLNKRVGFLNEAVKRTGLENARAVHMRAEDGGRDKSYRERFDIAAARAVADLAVLSEYALPFVKVGGYFLAMKGTAPEEETERAKRAIKLLGGRLEKVIEINIEPLQLKHTVAVIKKVEKTKAIYPRKAGTPSKKPL